MVGLVAYLALSLCFSLQYICLGSEETNYFRVNRKDLLISTLYHIRNVTNIDNLFFAGLLFSEYGANEPLPFASSICPLLHDKLKSQDLKATYEFIYKAFVSGKSQKCPVSKQLMFSFVEQAKNQKNYESFYYCLKLEQVSDHKCLLTQTSIFSEPSHSSMVFEIIYLLKQGTSNDRLMSLLSTVPLNSIVSASLLEDMKFSSELFQLYVTIMKDFPDYFTPTMKEHVVHFISKRYLYCDEPSINYFKAALTNLLEKHDVYIPSVTVDINSLIVGLTSPETSKLHIFVDSFSLNPVVEDSKALYALKDVILKKLVCGDESFSITPEQSAFNSGQFHGSYSINIEALLKDSKIKLHMMSCDAEIVLSTNNSKTTYTTTNFNVYFNILTDIVPYKSIKLFIPSRKQKFSDIKPQTKIDKQLILNNHEVMDIEVESNSDVYLIFDGPIKVLFKTEADPSEPKLHKFKLDLNTVDKSDFHFVSGKYDLKVMTYGDEAGPYPNPWIVGTIDIQFSEPAIYLRSLSSMHQKLTREIIESETFVQHQGSRLIAMCGIFAVISATMVGMAWICKYKIDVSMFYQLNLPAAIFFISLGAIFVLYFIFWIHLNMFDTLYITTFLLVVALLSLKYMY